MPQISKAVFTLLAFAALSLGSPSSARADELVLQQLFLIDGPVRIGSPFTINARFANPGSQTIFLTSQTLFEEGVFVGTRLYGQTAFLDPGQSGVFSLWRNITFLPGTPIGPTLLTFVIRGGAVPGATDVLATVRVQVNVAEAVPSRPRCSCSGRGWRGWSARPAGGARLPESELQSRRRRDGERGRDSAHPFLLPPPRAFVPARRTIYGASDCHLA